MNGINRRGQKVVCIAEINVFLGPGSFNPYGGPIPRPDETYTVEGFIESGFILSEIGSGRVPGLALREMPCAFFGTGEPMGWPVAGFKPVDERKTDISDLMPAPAEHHVLEPTG
jgi:hypothetical protein